MKKYIYLSIICISLLSAAELGTSTINNGGMLMLGVWRNYISPIDGPRCPFRPTCSEYARQAIKKYGIVKGTVMASERLQRCNGCHNYTVYQLTQEGYYDDPVSHNVY